MTVNNIQRLDNKMAVDLLEMQEEIKKRSKKFTSVAKITEYFPKLSEWNKIREAVVLRIVSDNNKDNRRVR